MLEVQMKSFKAATTHDPSLNLISCVKNEKVVVLSFFVKTCLRAMTLKSEMKFDLFLKGSWLDKRLATHICHTFT